MTTQYVIADRGATINLPPQTGATRWLAVAHAGSLRSQCPGLSILIQVRGRARVIAREGRFDLKPGDWLVLDRDSAPEVHADRHGVTIGVVAGEGGGRRQDLLPGAGRMSICSSTRPSSRCSRSAPRCDAAPSRCCPVSASRRRMPPPVVLGRNSAPAPTWPR